MPAQLVTDTITSRRGRFDALLHRSDQYTREQYKRLMTDNGVVCSMRRSGNVWDRACSVGEKLAGVSIGKTTPGEAVTLAGIGRHSVSMF